jgi:hypothetical protein
MPEELQDCLLPELTLRLHDLVRAVGWLARAGAWDEAAAAWRSRP